MALLLARLALGGALILGALATADVGPTEGGTTTPDERAYAWNCDATWWAFRVAPLSDGSVGVAYAHVPVGAAREAWRYQWSEPASLGGRVASQGDLDVSCLAGKVWVFAHFSAPVDGTAQLYERHAIPDDVATGSGQGWVDWYHWR